jgi:fructose-specific phosphotransferase system component IIB
VENKPVSETAHDFIMNSNSLTETQKTKLIELQSKVHAENSIIKEQIEKAKQVMVQTVLEPKMNEREFKILKKKITVLEKKRMENGFNAITEARLIINPKSNLDESAVYKTYMIKRLQEF